MDACMYPLMLEMLIMTMRMMRMMLMLTRMIQSVLARVVVATITMHALLRLIAWATVIWRFRVTVMMLRPAIMLTMARSETQMSMQMRMTPNMLALLILLCTLLIRVAMVQMPLQT